MTVREELKRHMEKEGVSINTVSKAVAWSAGALSLWLKDDYTGDNEKMERDVAAYLSRHEERAKVQTGGEFAMTRQAVAILGALRYAHTWGGMGVIYGRSGIGKSEAIKHYSGTVGGVIVITIDPVSLTPSAVLHDLAEAIGESSRGTLRGLLRRICKRLDKSGRLIIVDEAQFLTHRAIESLRKIHDTAKVAIVFVGMPRLYHHMIGNGVEIFEQLLTRFDIKKDIPSLTLEDAGLILRTRNASISEAACRVAFDLSFGCARRLDKLYNHAARAAASENRPIEPEDFIAAQEFLYEDSHLKKEPAPIVKARPEVKAIVKKSNGVSHGAAKSVVG